MTKINDGGPAFPVECQWRDDIPVQGAQTGNSQGYATGVTIRDYFAAKALVGLIAEPPFVPGSKSIVARLASSGLCEAQSLAEVAYLLADAMLAEREKGG